MDLPATAKIGPAAASSNDLPSDLKVQAMPMSTYRAQLGKNYIFPKEPNKVWTLCLEQW